MFRVLPGPRALVGLVSLAAAMSALAVPSDAAEWGGRAHLVLAGQTLWSIAYRYGVTVDELMRANRIADPAALRAGQTLRIPGQPAAAASHSPPRREPAAGSLMWPLRGRITSRYGWRGRRRHTGLDIAATKGTIIVAADGGTVVRAGGYWGRYGKVVLVEHGGGRKTLYAHVARSFVRKGQVVRRGQAIAAVGATGNATGPHLHFELWQGEATIDPLTVLRRGGPSQVASKRPISGPPAR